MGPWYEEVHTHVHFRICCFLPPTQDHYHKGYKGSECCHIYSEQGGSHAGELTNAVRSVEMFSLCVQMCHKINGPGTEHPNTM